MILHLAIIIILLLIYVRLDDIRKAVAYKETMLDDNWLAKPKRKVKK